MSEDHLGGLRASLLRAVTAARDDVIEWRGVRYIVLSPPRGRPLPAQLPYGVHVPAATAAQGGDSLLCLSPTKQQILLPRAECIPVTVEPGHVVDVVLAELTRIGVL
jgi:hypothetical protein